MLPGVKTEKTGFKMIKQLSVAHFYWSVINQWITETSLVSFLNVVTACRTAVSTLKCFASIKSQEAFERCVAWVQTSAQHFSTSTVGALNMGCWSVRRKLSGQFMEDISHRSRTVNTAWIRFRCKSMHRHRNVQTHISRCSQAVTNFLFLPQPRFPPNHTHLPPSPAAALLATSSHICLHLVFPQHVCISWPERRLKKGRQRANQ